MFYFPLRAAHTFRVSLLQVPCLRMLKGAWHEQEMTYVKQLEDYEEAVMQKRLDEMPQAERERILGEIEQQKQANGQQGKQ